MPKSEKIVTLLSGSPALQPLSQELPESPPDFYRLRIGIGRPPARGDVSNWVLGRPAADDQTRINDALDRALKVVFAFADKGVDAAVRACKPPKVKTTKEKTDNS